MAESDQVTRETPATGEGTTQSDGGATKSDAEALYGQDNAEDQGGEGEGTEGKEAEAADTPESYALRLPEGTLVDKPLLNEFTAWAREHNFTDEQAQRAAELHLKAIGGFARETAEYKQAGEQYLAKVKGWGAELERDLGANKAATVADALQVLNLFGTPAEVTRLRQDLQLYGWGDHPLLVKGLARVAGLLRDKLPGNQGRRLTDAEAIYGGK